jgi:hypothetical protein
MARHTITHTVTDPGRDNGKVFVITEMSALSAESWAFRAILALIKNGVNLPDGFENSGMAGIAEIGIKALSGLDYETAKPLLDEMLTCIKFIPDPKKPHLSRPLFEEDVEEVITYGKLRMEVWKLHVGFLKAAVPSKSATPAAAQVSSS